MIFSTSRRRRIRGRTRARTGKLKGYFSRFLTCRREQGITVILNVSTIKIGTSVDDLKGIFVFDREFESICLQPVAVSTIFLPREP